MRNFLTAITILLFFSFQFSSAQNQVKINPSAGVFIYNSENTLKITEMRNYILNYGFEVSYLNNNIFGYYIQVDYSHIYSGIDGTLEFFSTSGQDVGVFIVDVSLSFNTIEILLKNNLNDNLFLSIGPAFSFVNRSVFYDKDNFEDRLASFNIGLTSTLDMQWPFSDDSKDWFFYGGIKLRYLYGLIYDEKGRDLSNYNQHFLTLNLQLGIGYNF
jgi:hypothetical protein